MAPKQSAPAQDLSRPRRSGSQLRSNAGVTEELRHIYQKTREPNMPKVPSHHIRSTTLAANFGHRHPPTHLKLMSLGWRVFALQLKKEQMVSRAMFTLHRTE